jgi:hypothetical protein
MLFWNVSRKESKSCMFIVYCVVRFLCVVNLRMVVVMWIKTFYTVLGSMVGSFF